MSKGRGQRPVTPPRTRNPAFDQVSDRNRKMHVNQIERAGLDEAGDYLEKGDIDGAIAVLHITANWVARYEAGAPIRLESVK